MRPVRGGGGIVTACAIQYLVNDAEDDGVDEADPRHPHQAQEEQVRVPIQLEVCGFGVEDGAHQLAFLCAEACRSTRAPPLRLEPPTKICLITTATSCSAFLPLACSDDDGFHQFARVEAGLDHLGAAEQGVPLVLLWVVALRCLLACAGQTGLGNWYALSWRWKQDWVLMVLTRRCVLEGKFGRSPTCQHALIHDAGPLDQHGVAGHHHPIGWDGDDITRHQLRGHGLFKFCEEERKRTRTLNRTSLD